MHGPRPLLIAVLAFLAVSIAPGSATAQTTPVTCGGQVATIVGTPGDDVLVGTSGVDVIAALGGDDEIWGRAGNDILCGSHGNDKIYGGDGSDTIYAFNGADRLEGGKGFDTLYGGRGPDVLLGNNGRDLLKGGPGLDRLLGGAQRDTLYGGLHLDELFGGTELDTCYSPGDILDGCERGGGQAQAQAQTVAVVAGPSVTEQYANEMLNLINVERSTRSGLAPLTRHADLDSYAQDWAVAMSAQPLPLSGFRHHSPAFTGNPDITFRDLPDSVQWTTAFENVGYSTIGTGESVDSVLDRLFYSPNGFGFMTSDGHRCNILESAAGQVGLGAHIDSQGQLWVAQVFWGTDSPLPTPVSECTGIANR